MFGAAVTETAFLSLAIGILGLCALPPKVFSKRGLASPRGIGSLVGHGLAAGFPGALWAQAFPGEALKALVLACAGVVAVGSLLVATRIRIALPRVAPAGAGAVAPASPSPRGGIDSGTPIPAFDLRERLLDGGRPGASREG